MLLHPQIPTVMKGVTFLPASRENDLLGLWQLISYALTGVKARWDRHISLLLMSQSLPFPKLLNFYKFLTENAGKITSMNCGISFEN